MYQIKNVQADNLLVQKVEKENKSEFISVGDNDKKGAIYRVCYAGENIDNLQLEKDALVLLKPGTYPGVLFNNEMFTVIDEQDILAVVGGEE